MTRRKMAKFKLAFKTIVKAKKTSKFFKIQAPENQWMIGK
jgi:hypothetical protein